jgi:peptidoglycan/xylan/chitin deacetylase (PgdA/CDA1 family)
MIKSIKENKELWDIFTLKEEYETNKFDHHNRFLYKYSSKSEIINPKVSNYLFKKGYSIQWPEHKTFAVCLTHDIDEIYPSSKYRCYTSMKYLIKGYIRKSMNRALKKENPYWNFGEIINLEKKYNAKSTFFIMADKSNYNLNDLKDELYHISQEGYEIGLHGGFNAYNDLSTMKKEKEILERLIEKKIIGYRNHYLSFEIPLTWKLLEKAGFKYDSTLGFADQVGFRNGMCHPFKPVDIQTGNQIPIFELPLIIMDASLLGYMGLTIKDSMMISKKLIDVVKNIGGVITILWHNTYFDDIYRKGWEKLYENILEYCSKQNAWMTTGKSIVNVMDEQQYF